MSEPLWGYIKRFTMAYTNVKDPNESFVIQEFKAGVINEHVYYTICNKDITSMHELVTYGQALVEVEEMRNNHLGRARTLE